MNNLSDVKEKVLKGLILLVLRDFGLKIISIIGQIILVRLIAPEYFGIFAIISFAVNFFELFTDFGLSQAIVQNKNNITNIQLSTIFYLKLILSTLAFILLIFSFSTIKLFYHQLNDSNFFMVAMLGLIIVIKSIRNIIFALFDKNLNFTAVSKIDLIGVIVYVIVAIIFAIKKIYVWNFIYAILAKEIIELIITFYYNPWKPIFAFDINSIKQMLKYGSFLQIGNIVSFVEKSLVPIVGFRLSSNSLGLLDWSSKVAGLSNTLFENFGRVAFAGMVKIQDKKDKLSLAINKSVSILNIFSFLFIILVLGFGKEIMMIVLSDKWVPALPALYWFVSGLLFFGASITIAHALLAMGKSKEVTLFSGLVIFGEIALSFFLVNKIGFTGIAIASFTGYFIQLVGYYLLGRKFDLNIKLGKPFFEKMLIFSASLIMVMVLNNLFPDFSLTTLTIKIIGTVGIYIIFLLVFSKDDIKELLSMTNLFRGKNLIS